MKFYRQLAVATLCFCHLHGAQFVAKNYDYLLDRMPKFTPAMLELHMKLYQGYVDQTNALDKLLSETVASPDGEKSFTYQSIKRRYAWEYDGMKFHELYFDNLGGKGVIPPKSSINEKIIRQFGSYQNWVKDFKATCSVRGIGWAILYFDAKHDRLTNVWVEEHNLGLLADQTPILVVDLWEHAYLCQFRLDRQKYVDVVLSYLDWDVIDLRLELAAMPQNPPGI